MGVCLSHPQYEPDFEVQTPGVEHTNKRVIPPAPIDYKTYPWSEKVKLIISYWNRNADSFTFLNKDIESLIRRFSLNDLVLKEWTITTFKPNQLYEFSNIIIKYKAILTTEKYDKVYNPNGGKLLLRSFGDFIVENGGVIDLNGKGYSGGIRGKKWSNGLSYAGESAYKNRIANYGGGGCCTQYSVLWCLSSGGGGYGTKGENGLCITNNGSTTTKRDEGQKRRAEYEFQGLGGNTYGDKELRTLHLGSGGGASEYCNGGNGGGALKIMCHKFINHGIIEVNRKKGGGATKNGGGGSGGSCLIIVYGNEFDNERGLISCKGAQSIHQYGRGGAGGDGRICIRFLKDKTRHSFAKRNVFKTYTLNKEGTYTKVDGKKMDKNLKNIEPKPYVIRCL